MNERDCWKTCHMMCWVDHAPLGNSNKKCRLVQFADRHKFNWPTRAKLGGTLCSYAILQLQNKYKITVAANIKPHLYIMKLLQQNINSAIAAATTGTWEQIPPILQFWDWQSIGLTTFWTHCWKMHIILLWIFENFSRVIPRNPWSHLPQPPLGVGGTGSPTKICTHRSNCKFIIFSLRPTNCEKGRIRWFRIDRKVHCEFVRELIAFMVL